VNRHGTVTSTRAQLFLLAALAFLFMLSTPPDASAQETLPAGQQLNRAIQTLSSDAFEAALAAGANPGVADAGGDNALHKVVIFWGDTNAMSRLLSLGVDVNLSNQSGETPLLLALRTTHYRDPARSGKVVDFLLARGANSKLADKSGNTPMSLALDSGNLAMVEKIARSGALLPPDALLKALAVGAGSADVERIRFLMAHAAGLDLKLRNGWGQTLLHRAAGHARLMFLLRWLVERGLDPQVRDNNRDTALDEAASGGNLEGLIYLHSLGLRLDSVGRDERQAIHTASYDPRLPVLSWLVANGADLKARDRWGRTPLEIVIGSRRFAFAKEADRLALAGLLGGGPTDVQRGAIGNHPLHVAWGARDLGEVRRLLEAGADPDTRNEDGQTLMYSAIMYAAGSPATREQMVFGRAVLMLLFEHGADSSLLVPMQMVSHDEFARGFRYGDEFARLKLRYSPRKR
jgi:ankyrin repeat protein